MSTVEVEREITRLYEAGTRTGELAARFGVKKQQVAKIVRRNGGQVRGRGANRLPPEREAQMVALYAEGMSAGELKKRFGVHVTSIPRIIRRYDVPLRPQRRPHREFTGAEVEEMARLWTEDGLSQTGIAKRFDTAQVVVSRVLRSAGITPVARAWRAHGEQHGSWKGGRHIDGNGYVLVLVDPDDPMAEMRSRSGYVREHRLVMARALGRSLRRNESVHHINGDKQDNRLENLQLRNGQHGKGVVAVCAGCGSRDIVFDRLTDSEE